MRGLGQELLAEALLDLPEVGRLPAEGGAMHESEAWEVVSVVAPEVGEELRIFVEPQELTDDLDCEHFRIPECWGGSARPRRRPRSAIRSSMRQKTAMMMMKVL
jgi:hypothetical protein